MSIFRITNYKADLKGCLGPYETPVATWGRDPQEFGTNWVPS